MEMSKSEVLYVKGMNISESDGEDENEHDIWDDRKLNDAYDKALRIANAEVAKRVAMSTNSQQEDKDDRSKSKKEKTNRPNSSKSHQKKEQWKAGMPCRSVYDGDGLEYEAFVVRIINDKECVIRYLGYENSEIVPISDLKPTLGKDARTLQIEQVHNEKAEERFGQSPTVDRMEFGSDRAISPGSTERSFQRKKKSAANKKKKSPNQNQCNLNGFELPDIPLGSMPNASFMRNLGTMDMPMPPPPLTFPSSSDRVDTEEQAVSSMLLSWYMSGYYTGLYQGLKRAKENRRN